MRTKNLLFAALIATASLASMTATATAHPYHGEHHDRGHDRDDRNWGDRGWDGRNWGDREGSINDRQGDISRRIDRGLRDGSLTRREAYRLQDDNREIARLEAVYRYNGLSGWERADLDRRLDRLEGQVRGQRRDRDYGAGYYR